jgi:polar amino acid transport system permease protein
MGQWYGYFGLMLEGARITIGLTVLGCALALVLAFIAGLGRLSRFAPLRWLATAYIEFFRGTSIFVQLFWVYFVLPLAGVEFTPFVAGVLVLGLNVSAYAAEVVRGGILSVGKEQREASVALNLTRWQSLRYVILPQAFLYMLPTFGNNAIELLKATAIVSLISLADLTFQAQVVRAQTGNTAIPFITILVIYFLLAMAITTGIRTLERRMTRGLDGMRA